MAGQSQDFAVESSCDWPCVIHEAAISSQMSCAIRVFTATAAMNAGVSPSLRCTHVRTTLRPRVPQRASIIAHALTPEEERRYFVLGVSPGASQEAVKRAYKRMAKLHHPDVNLEDPLAPAKFAEINEAYHALCAERGNLATRQGSEEQKEKWSAQLRQMRDVEAGKARVNVRRRRVIRKVALDEEMEKERDRLEDIMRESEGNEDIDAAWREDDVTDEVRRAAAAKAVASQLGGLRDRTRRRRQVVPPQKNKFKEPFEDVSPTAHDDEWNHSVQ